MITFFFFFLILAALLAATKGWKRIIMASLFVVGTLAIGFLSL